MSRHLKLNNSFPVILLFAVVLSGCGRDKQKADYVARVNNSYLTEEELTAISGANGGQTFFKEEIIRNWVDRELLYQLAEKEGITESREYKRILLKSSKELAASMMLQKIYSGKLAEYKDEEILSYFNENKELFSITQQAYVINSAEFSDEEKAIKFRTAAVESDWIKALNFFNNNPVLIRQETNKLFYSYDLQPLGLTRIAGELIPGEVSLVFPAGKNFIVVKLISRLENGTIPPYDIIKDKIKNRFMAVRKSEILKEFYRELYSVNDIDVKQ